MFVLHCDNSWDLPGVFQYPFGGWVSSVQQKAWSVQRSPLTSSCSHRRRSSAPEKRRSGRQWHSVRVRVRHAGGTLGWLSELVDYVTCSSHTARSSASNCCLSCSWLWLWRAEWCSPFKLIISDLIWCTITSNDSLRTCRGSGRTHQHKLIRVQGSKKLPGVIDFVSILEVCIWILCCTGLH